MRWVRPWTGSSGPLIRIVDVALGSSDDDAHDLVLTVSHIIADGMAALSLLRGLVGHADRLSAVDCLDDVVRSRPVVASLEDLLPARYRGLRGLATFAASGLADLLAMTTVRPHRLALESIVGTERRTKFVRRVLGSAELDTLTRRCRAEGVTVHGALIAAMAMAIGPTAAHKDSGRIWIASAINMRERAGDHELVQQDPGGVEARVLDAGADQDQGSGPLRAGRARLPWRRVGPEHSSATSNGSSTMVPG